MLIELEIAEIRTYLSDFNDFSASAIQHFLNLNTSFRHRMVQLPK
jgi:hypothetical protein